MALKGFKTLPGTVEITTSLNTFKTTLQAVWTGSSWRSKGTFSPTHGDTSSWPGSSSYAIERQASMYLGTDSTGLRIGTTSGEAHTQNFECYGDGRWMPASVFNGCGFEVHQNSSGKQALYLKKWALIFASRTSGSYRFWGFNAGTSSPSNTYRYIEVSSNNSATSSIRSWGSGWVFQGILVHVANNSGIGTTQSALEVYNMRVGHKFSTVGGAYRYLPPTMRPYSKRNASSGNVGFTNPFTPK